MRFISDNLINEHKNWFLWFPVSFAGGCGVYFSLGFEPDFSLLFVFIAVIFLAAVRMFLKEDIIFRFISVCLVFFAMGFGYSELHTNLRKTVVIEERIGAVSVIGDIEDIKYLSSDNIRITLNAPEIEGFSGFPERVSISVRGKNLDEYEIGQKITLRAMLYPASRPSSPYSFDFSRYAWFRGISGYGYSLGLPIIGLDFDKRLSWRMRINKLRDDIYHHIHSRLSGQKAAIASALIVGKRDGISATSLESIRNAGLAHILAISGLHVGLLSALCFIFFRFTITAINPKRFYLWAKEISAFMTIPVIFLYLLLSGHSVPTQRAFIMAMIAFTAIILGHQPISMRILAIAAGVILIFTPFAIMGLSFQLSFAAVIALVALFEYYNLHKISDNIYGRHNLIRKIKHYLLAIIVSSIAASTVTMPLLLYHFQKVALLAALSNLIAIPVMSLWIMPCGILALLLMNFGMDNLAFRLMGIGIDIILKTADYVSSLSFASFITSKFPFYILLIFTIGFLWLSLWQRKWRLIGIIPLSLGFLLSFVYRDINPPDLMIYEKPSLFAISFVEDDLWLISDDKPKRVVEGWSRIFGSARFLTWEKAKDMGIDTPLCDYEGCIYDKNGYKIAFVKHISAISEDCMKADIIITYLPIYDIDCPRPRLVINGSDLAMNGGYALWLEKDDIKVLTVRQRQGQRPWVNK